MLSQSIKTCPKEPFLGLSGEGRFLAFLGLPEGGFLRGHFLVFLTSVLCLYFFYYSFMFLLIVLKIFCASGTSKMAPKSAFFNFFSFLTKLKKIPHFMPKLIKLTIIPLEFPLGTPRLPTFLPIARRSFSKS